MTSKMNQKQNQENKSSLEIFTNYIVKVAICIQDSDFTLDGKKTPGLYYNIPKEVRKDIKHQVHFLDFKYNIITELSKSTKDLNAKLKKDCKIQIYSNWCKMNGICKPPKKEGYRPYPHSPSSIMFALFNRGILKIDHDEEKTYCILSIDKSINIKEAMTQKTNQMNKLSQEDFLDYITKVCTGLQNTSFIMNEVKTYGLYFKIPKKVRGDLQNQEDFLSYQYDIITDTSLSIKDFNAKIEKDFDIQIYSNWCKMNGICKTNKKGLIFAHTPSSIMFVIFNKGILEIDHDEEKTYCILSIDKSINIKEAMFAKNSYNSYNSYNSSSTRVVDDDESDDEDD